jgi:hypothetical protein
MQLHVEDPRGAAEDGASLRKLSIKVGDEKQPTMLQTDNSPEEPDQSLTLHGLRLWMLLLVLYISIYLLALELTMLSTVIPTLTNEFHTVADISWYESAYVLPL